MYMDVARRISQMSHCTRSQVGAIIVQADNIVSFGWNGQPAGFPNKCEADDEDVTLPTVLHAEDNAIKKIQDTPHLGKAATLYLTMTPCRKCAEKIFNFGITRVVFQHDYRLTDGAEFLRQHGVIVDQLSQ